MGHFGRNVCQFVDWILAAPLNAERTSNDANRLLLSFHWTCFELRSSQHRPMKPRHPWRTNQDHFSWCSWIPETLHTQGQVCKGIQCFESREKRSRFHNLSNRSWDYLLCVKDDIPQFVKLIICMFHRVVVVQFHWGNELENLKQDCVLIFRESEVEVFLHILIIHENQHPWENSGQLTNWISAAFFPAGVLNKKTYWE